MEGLSSSSYKEKEKQENNNIDEVVEHEDDGEILRTRILNHPLYGLLLETHMDCLKVSQMNGDQHYLEENDSCRDMKELDYNFKASLGLIGQSDLDHFMEAYCLALGKLKEAMEEPQQNSMAFITNMHLQLKELTTSHLPDQPPTPTPTTLSGLVKSQR